MENVQTDGSSDCCEHCGGLVAMAEDQPSGEHSTLCFRCGHQHQEYSGEGGEWTVEDQEGFGAMLITRKYQKWHQKRYFHHELSVDEVDLLFLDLFDENVDSERSCLYLKQQGEWRLLFGNLLPDAFDEYEWDYT